MKGQKTGQWLAKYFSYTYKYIIALDRHAAGAILPPNEEIYRYLVTPCSSCPCFSDTCLCLVAMEYANPDANSHSDADTF